MFNPFEEFRGKYIDAFRKAGKSYLVSQTYDRGRDPVIYPEKIPILLSHYSGLVQASIHLSALSGDKYAAIIDLEKESHRDKVMEMLRKDSKYVVYSTLYRSMAETEKRMKRKFKDNIQKYIAKNTNWRIGSDKTIESQLETAFGELFIILKYGSQQIRFQLSELEKV